MLAAKLPNSDLNFAVDFLVDFPLFVILRKKARKNPPKIPRKIHPGLCPEKFPSDFCRSLLLKSGLRELWVWRLGAASGQQGAQLTVPEASLFDISHYALILTRPARGQDGSGLPKMLHAKNPRGYVRCWRVPNLIGANPLVAARAPWRSSQSCDRGSAAYWKSLQNPVISSAPGNPCATPIVTRGEGSFSYQGVSTRGVRHAPEVGARVRNRQMETDDGGLA